MISKSTVVLITKSPYKWRLTHGRPLNSLRPEELTSNRDLAVTLATFALATIVDAQTTLRPKSLLSLMYQQSLRLLYSHPLLALFNATGNSEDLVVLPLIRSASKSLNATGTGQNGQADAETLVPILA